MAGKGNKRKYKSKEESSKKLKQNEFGVLTRSAAMAAQMNKNLSSSNNMTVENITNLPDEILLKIFGCLSTYDLLKRVSLVCKDFYRLSQDSSVIKEIVFNSDSKKDVALKAYDVIRQSRNLNKLIISGDKYKKPDIRAGNFISIAIKNCPNLRHIEFQKITDLNYSFNGNSGIMDHDSTFPTLLDFGLDNNLKLNVINKAAEVIVSWPAVLGNSSSQDTIDITKKSEVERTEHSSTCSQFIIFKRNEIKFHGCTIFAEIHPPIILGE